MTKKRVNGTIRRRVYRFVANYLEIKIGAIKPKTLLTGRLGSKDFWVKVSMEFDLRVQAFERACKTVGGLSCKVETALRGTE